MTKFNFKYHPLQFTHGIPATPQYGYMVCCGVPKYKTVPIPMLPILETLWVFLYLFKPKV